MTQAKLVITLPDPCQGSGALQSISRFNVTPPHVLKVQLSEARSLYEIATMVLKYVPGATGIVRYSNDYNNGNSNDFNYNLEQVIFDGMMRIKDKYEYPFYEVEDGYFETEEIDFLDFIDIGGIGTFDVNDGKITLYGLKSITQIATANEDISLVGVENIDNVKLTSVSSGNGKALISVSFDAGNTYEVFKGGAWRVITDEADFIANGMTANEINAVTSSNWKNARGSSDKMRFRYLLHRQIYNDHAAHDRITVNVSMFGVDIVAPTADYDISYNDVTGEMTFEFFKNGTFTVNYVEGG